eukprot:TRINITY_DN95964_c0_g1_i1.p1 TRINITY_DN95964_c0_g1~~TRINITY_DN95964_c0_g1_i1.p1  ORF type:complete len:318 (-),score=47.71 TRINITY_DN95964_c0_g1_i1:50-1003(-)
MFSLAARDATPLSPRHFKGTPSTPKSASTSVGSPWSSAASPFKEADVRDATSADSTLHVVCEESDADASIEAFVEQNVIAFLRRYQILVKGGHTSFTFFSQERHLRDLIKTSIYPTEDVARQAVTKRFEEKLAEVGPPGTLVQLRLSKPSALEYLWIFSAAWGAGCAAVPTPQGQPVWTMTVHLAAHSGPLNSCSKCHEISGAVELVPCAHTTCAGCALQLVRSKCPCCLTQVGGITNVVEGRSSWDIVELPDGPKEVWCKCKETSGCVTLVPCGHTACGKCAVQLTGKTCPCCGAKVAGITDTQVAQMMPRPKKFA